MILHLTGILRDGLVTVGLNANARPAITVWQKTDAVVRVRVVAADGRVLPTSAFASLTLTVKPRTADAAAVLTIVAVPDTQAKEHVFTIPAASTRAAKTPAGTYLYDVTGVDGAGLRDTLIPASSFVVLQSIGA